MDVVAQRIVNNEMDSALDMRSSVIANILAQNDKTTTHTGDESPYGYLDWWPNSLWVNTQLAPYDDPLVRRAVSRAINRDLIDEILYEGAPIATIYPFPLYPGLQAFVDSPEVKALEEKYQPRKYDPDESAALMEEAGFTRNGDDLWEKDGETANMTIHAFEGIHSDIVPILVEMLLNAGFDAAINFGTDSYQNMVDGAPGPLHVRPRRQPEGPLRGARTVPRKVRRVDRQIRRAATASRATPTRNTTRFSTRSRRSPSEDPKFHENAAKALEIYWRDQIDIPIIQWLHRIAYNQTNWTNWPTAANPAMGTNGAFWAHTGLPVIASLQKAN